MTCQTCDGPLIWSADHRQMWCAVYGTHPTITPIKTPRNRAVAEVLRYDRHTRRNHLKAV